MGASRYLYIGFYLFLKNIHEAKWKEGDTFKKCPIHSVQTSDFCPNCGCKTIEDQLPPTKEKSLKHIFDWETGEYEDDFINIEGDNVLNLVPNEEIPGGLYLDDEFTLLPFEEILKLKDQKEEFIVKNNKYINWLTNKDFKATIEFGLIQWYD